MYLGPLISDHHMCWCFGKVLLWPIKRDVWNCDERAALAIATPPNSSQPSAIHCFSIMLLIGDYTYLGPQISDCCIWWCFGTLFVCAIRRDARKFAKRTATDSDLPRNSNVLPKQFLFEHAANGRKQIYLATELGLLHVMMFWNPLCMRY